MPAIRSPPDRPVTKEKRCGELAQLGERLVCNQEVTGSSPVFSTSLRESLASLAPEAGEPGERTCEGVHRRSEGAQVGGR